jgi:hypothetical protein
LGCKLDGFVIVHKILERGFGVKLFAAAFSLFCVYILSPAEASADSLSKSPCYQRLEKCLRSCSQNSVKNKSCHNHPFSNAVFENFIFDFVTAGKKYFGEQSTFQNISAKDFYIRTGLSPPHLLS